MPDNHLLDRISPRGGTSSFLSLLLPFLHRARALLLLPRLGPWFILAFLRCQRGIEDISSTEDIIGSIEMEAVDSREENIATVRSLASVR